MQLAAVFEGHPKKTDTGPESIVFFHPPAFLYRRLLPNLCIGFGSERVKSDAVIIISAFNFVLTLKMTYKTRPRLRESATAVLRNLCVN